MEPELILVRTVARSLGSPLLLSRDGWQEGGKGTRAVSTRPRRDDAANARPAKAEVGALVGRLRDLGRPRTPQAAAETRGEMGEQKRISILEERVAHLEAALEGLQDAVDRQAVMQDERVADLRRRTEPDEMARALSDDARRRGL